MLVQIHILITVIKGMNFIAYVYEYHRLVKK